MDDAEGGGVGGVAFPLLGEGVLIVEQALHSVVEFVDERVESVGSCPQGVRIPGLDGGDARTHRGRPIAVSAATKSVSAIS